LAGETRHVRIMSIFYNGQFFCEARGDGTPKHDTSQDKTYVSLCFASPCNRGGTHVCYLYNAREIIHPAKNCRCLANSLAQPPQERREAGAVARELASHLRLKPTRPEYVSAWYYSGEGTGFSSEIETSWLLYPGESVHKVARELASHLRLKRASGKRAIQ
jgi:hypothetical protein